MMFIDGENLTMRFQDLLGDQSPPGHVTHERDVFVWSAYANLDTHNRDVVRRYYYTSAPGAAAEHRELESRIRRLGVERPRVFPRIKNRGSKRVDISLATDMLTHAHRKNYDVAVLVAGDADYVPLVEAVEAEGRRVVLWFLNSGLSDDLVRAADFFWDIGALLLETTTSHTLQSFMR